MAGTDQVMMDDFMVYVMHTDLWWLDIFYIDILEGKINNGWNISFVDKNLLFMLFNIPKRTYKDYINVYLYVYTHLCIIYAHIFYISIHFMC